MTPFESTVTQEKPASVKPLTEGRTGALLAVYKNGLKAVLKPTRERLPNGKRTQRSIEVKTHPQREVAYYQLARLLGWTDMVPETVLTMHEDRPASAQVFMPAYHLKQLQPDLADIDREDWKDLLVHTALRVPKIYWQRLLAMDIIAGTRDRHANNIGLVVKLSDDGPQYRLVAWDNAVTFGLTFDRYHNVFHKYLFRKHVNFDTVWPVLDKVSHEDLQIRLGPYLSAEEISHAYLRLTFFRDFPYRLPWLVVSGGHDHLDEFPSHKDYFEPVVERPQDVVPLGQARV